MSYIKSFDIKSDMPTVLEATARLSDIVRTSKKSEKIIKIIHGYGSTGVGGKIRLAVRQKLTQMLKSHEIKAYIPGEAFSLLMGFDDVIKKYKHLIKDDSDFRKGNDGITYVIF